MEAQSAAGRSARGERGMASKERRRALLGAASGYRQAMRAFADGEEVRIVSDPPLAESYADQNERDFEGVSAAVESGEIKAEV